MYDLKDKNETVNAAGPVFTYCKVYCTVYIKFTTLNLFQFF